MGFDGRDFLRALDLVGLADFDRPSAMGKPAIGLRKTWLNRLPTIAYGGAEDK